MKNKGYTLLELMIVIAIIMVLSAGTMFGLKGRAKKNELLRLKNEIKSQMETVTLKAYETGVAGIIDLKQDQITLSLSGSQPVIIDSKFYMFNVTAQSISISAIGAFTGNFEIGVREKGKTTDKFRIIVDSKLSHLGVSNIIVE